MEGGLQGNTNEGKKKWWDLGFIWRSAGFTDGLDIGVGGFGRIVKKREDAGRLG